MKGLRFVASCLLTGARRRSLFLFIMSACFLLSFVPVFVYPGLHHLSLSGKGAFLPLLPFIIPPFAVLVVFSEGYAVLSGRKED
jgi:hypothetical protein